MRELHRFDSFDLENVDDNVCIALSDIQQAYYLPKSEMWKTLKDGDELSKYAVQEKDAIVKSDENGNLYAEVDGLKIGYLPDNKKANADAYKVIFTGGASKRIVETPDGNLDYEMEDGRFVARLICYNFKNLSQTSKAAVSKKSSDAGENRAINAAVWLFVLLSIFSLFVEAAGVFFALPVPIVPAIVTCILCGVIAWGLSSRI